MLVETALGLVWLVWCAGSWRITGWNVFFYGYLNGYCGTAMEQQSAGRFGTEVSIGRLFAWFGVPGFIGRPSDTCFGMFSARNGCLEATGSALLGRFSVYATCAAV